MEWYIDRFLNFQNEISPDYMKFGELLEVYIACASNWQHKLNQAFMSEKLETRIEQLIDQSKLHTEN